MNRRRAIHAYLSILAFSSVAAGCARAPLALPTGPGRPAAEYAPAFREATDQCRTVRTFQGTINLSGHAGDARLRGRIDAGLAEPDRVRLEGVSPIPFGRPAFVLAGSSGDATLVLAREKRVLAGATTESIIEAITGVALRPDELLAVLSGCGFVQEAPADGRVYDDDWMAVQRGDRTNWMRRVEGRWRTVATTRGTLQVRYEALGSSTPSRIRIRTGPAAAVDADITLRVSDVDLNAPLAPEVFRVEIPDDAAPISIEEFRRSLGTAKSGAEAAGPAAFSGGQGPR